MKFNIAFVQEFDKIEKFYSKTVEAVDIVKNIPKYEKKLLAMKRFYFWMQEMKKKEIKIEEIIVNIVKKRKSLMPKGKKKPKGFSEFEENVCVWHDLVSSAGDGNGMSPYIATWFYIIADYDPKGLKDTESYKNYMKDVYPELLDLDKIKKHQARQHVLQYFVRREIIGHQFLFELFYAEFRIRKIKQTVKHKLDASYSKIIDDKNLPTGQVMKICGLKSAVQHNGKTVLVKGMKEDRYVVSDGYEKVAIKRMNLEALKFDGVEFLCDPTRSYELFADK